MLTTAPSCPQWTLRLLLRGQHWFTHPHNWALTLFKLDPHTSIILDLLNHLSAPANDHANRMPRHWHLREMQREGQLSSVPTALLPTGYKERLTPRVALHLWGKPTLTSIPPPIRDPYSFLSPKPPWSRSRRMSITISQAC